MSAFAVIPVKTLLKSKTRLLKVLKPQERLTLTLSMLEDVLRAVTASSSIHKVVIVGSDPRVQEFVGDFGAIYLPEKRRGLNQAVKQAVSWCIQNDAKMVLVLPADIPLITPNDLDQIVSLGSEEPSVIIAPSHNGGTNALSQKPPSLIPFHFGPESFNKHLAEASNRGIAAKVYRSQRVTMDIDSSEDLENLLEIEAQTASYRFLKQIGLDARLRGNSLNR